MVAYIHADKSVIIPPDKASFQDWNAYTADDHTVWGELFDRQLVNVQSRACPEWLEGMKKLGLVRDHIPNYHDLNKRLYAETGWTIAVVKDYIPADLFFYLLSHRHFPVTAWIRKREQMDYLPEPDIFHDVWAHDPVLTVWPFADFLHTFGKAGVEAQKRGALAQAAALYWYTVEFGLIKRPGQDTKIYGAGILSSSGETLHVLDSPEPHHIGFDAQRATRTRFLISQFQRTYFVIQDFAELLKLNEQAIVDICVRAKDDPGIFWSELLPTDHVIQRGTEIGQGPIIGNILRGPVDRAARLVATLQHTRV